MTAEPMRGVDEAIGTIAKDILRIIETKALEFSVMCELVPQVLLLVETFPSFSMEQKKHVLIESLVTAVNFHNPKLDASIDPAQAHAHIVKQKEQLISMIRTCVPIMIDMAIFAAKGYLILSETSEKCNQWWGNLLPCCCKSKVDIYREQIQLNSAELSKIPVHRRLQHIRQKYAIVKFHCRKIGLTCPN
jgi:hypothetical protein